MNGPSFPADWDEERVRRLIAHHDQLTEDEQMVEDGEAAEDRVGQTVITVPDDLLPAMRRILASFRGA